MSDNQIRQETLKQLGIDPEELGLRQHQRLDEIRDNQVQVIEPEPARDSSEAKVKVVEPDDDHEPGSAKLEETVAEEDVKQTKISNLEEQLGKTVQERDATIAKVKTLEDNHKQEAETAKAQAKELHAELEAVEKDAKAIKAELEDTKSQLRESQHKVRILETEIEAAKCPNPKCKKIVGWDNLKVKELPENEFQNIGKPLSTLLFKFPFNFSQKTVRFRECPVCGHIKEVKEEQK